MRFCTLSLFAYLLLLLSLSWTCCDGKKSWADIAASKPKVVENTLASISDSATASATKTPVRRKHGVYDSLPPTAQAFRVQHVYDGDTLTLVDQRRVRFFGIDTPELQPVQQTFSQEAKAYTKQYCRKQQDVYLDIMQSGDGSGKTTDKYGRLLAVVWAKTEHGNYQNVCEGLVAAGLATAYFTKENSSSTTKRQQQAAKKNLIQIQAEARQHRVGLWKHFADRNVVVTKYGTAYHLPTCRHLARSRNTRVLAASKALDQGLHPCRSCLADE